MERATDALTTARQAYGRRDWAAARVDFLAARDVAPLGFDDLAALSDAAWWLGRTDEALAVAEEAYRSCASGDDRCRAARLAIDIGFLSMARGDVAVGSGWIHRAERLLAGEPDCVEQALLLYLGLDDALGRGAFEDALASARRICEIGTRFGDRTTEALGLTGEGVTLVKQGRVADGIAVLDEAMLPVTAGLVAPDWAGSIYCVMISTCHELTDLRRAREWTAATERWCAGFSSAVMFAGICRVHRAQLHLVEGGWDLAEHEASRVRDDLADMNVAVVAEAEYLIGEVHRLRGDLAQADAAYGRAHERGRDPQPGLALLHLARGRAEAAAASLRTALVTAAHDLFGRARLHPAVVETALAAGDVSSAQESADELERAVATGVEGGIAASACQARGAVLLAEGSAEKALPLLREALRRWQELRAPYDAARVRVLMGHACRAVGDDDGADRELRAAGAAFGALGAVPDQRRVADLRNQGRAGLPDGLTAREAEVLGCVAAGLRNRDIAASLHISEKTVARHLSNIFTKLGLSSRTEAAAYAIDHRLAR